MKKIILTSIFTSVFILLGSINQVSALANPASVKCIADGGTSVIKKDAAGNESADCKFPNGAVCDEWAYFRGECSAKAVTTVDQLPAACTNAFDGCNTCSRTSGGIWMCTRMACMDVKQPAVVCTGYTKTDDKPVACTLEYAPVCGKQVLYVGAIDFPTPTEVVKTYSNSCMMKAVNATLVSEGACPADTGKPAFCSDNSFKKLTRGSRGEYVQSLQKYLSDNGYNPGSIDGVFGRGVVDAVRAFQRDKGITADGVFGNRSRAQICNSTAPIIAPNPVYSVTITADKGPQLVGGSAQFKTVEINVSGLTAPKLSDIAISYDSYPVVPNPVHTTQVKNLSMNLENGQNKISQVPLGPILSVTIDGKNVPFQQN